MTEQPRHRQQPIAQPEADVERATAHRNHPQSGCSRGLGELTIGTRDAAFGVEPGGHLDQLPLGSTEHSGIAN